MAILTIGAVNAAENASAHDVIAFEEIGDESLEASLSDDDALAREADENQDVLA